MSIAERVSQRRRARAALRRAGPLACLADETLHIVLSLLAFVDACALAQLTLGPHALFRTRHALRLGRQVLAASIPLGRADACALAANAGIVLRRFRNDRPLVLAAVSVNGAALAAASIRLVNDRAVVLAAVQRWGYAVAYAASVFRDDVVIALAACTPFGG